MHILPLRLPRREVVVPKAEFVAILTPVEVVVKPQVRVDSARHPLRASANNDVALEG
jgi:hypothetical protein